MRVLISAAFFGGAGGSERALFSVLKALDQDEVDVVVRRRLRGAYARTGPRSRIYTVADWRWRGATRERGPAGRLLKVLVNPARRMLSQPYDVYLHYYHGMRLDAAASAAVKLLVPAGKEVSEEAAKAFDYVALEAPGNRSLVPASVATTLLPPPLYELCGESSPPSVLLPERYYLTVFNPFGPSKGMADLEVAADSSPLPIVWCHSEASVRFSISSKLERHPNVVHVVDAPPGQLRFLYENCEAYVAFSRSEGFGWSIADALRYSPNVISRPIGVLSFPEAASAQGVHLVGEQLWDFAARDARPTEDSPERDLTFLAPHLFRRRLVRLLDHGVGTVIGQR